MRKVVASVVVGSLAFGATEGAYVPSWQLFNPLEQNRLLQSIDLTQARSVGLDYLNYLRGLAGMTPLTSEVHLDEAALNHTNYIILNNVVSHYENSGDSGYTGYSPADRAVAAGYPSRYVLENLSTGQGDVNGSIDDLFSAIYHRMAFLDETIDQVGIGAGESSNADIRTVFVYDMGNSNLAQLCANGGSTTINGSYYTNVCSNEDIQISVDDYSQAMESIAGQNPAVILWPTPGQTDVPPVFYEEYPDPLPDYSVSGYPVSVLFNRYKFQNLPTVTNFRIFRADTGEEITDVRLLNAATDPNEHLGENQYVLFPLQRLEWGTEYRVELTYHDNDLDEDKLLQWSFVTRTLDVPYYKIDPNSVPDSVSVEAGLEYAIYVVPKDGVNITITGFSYNVADFQYSQIDMNTLRFKVSGDLGQYVEFRLSNGASFKVVISDSDSAIYPSTQEPETNTTLTTLTQGQLETLQMIEQAPQGEWVLLGALDTLYVADINTSFKIIWSYEGGWAGYSPDPQVQELMRENNITTLVDIGRGMGFWILK